MLQSRSMIPWLSLTAGCTLFVVVNLPLAAQVPLPMFVQVSQQEATIIAACIQAMAGILALFVAVCGWYKVAELNLETEKEKHEMTLAIEKEKHRMTLEREKEKHEMTIKAAAAEGQKKTLQTVIGPCCRRAVI